MKKEYPDSFNELFSGYGVLRHFPQSFSYIMAVLLVEETEVPETNHQPAVSHWHTLSHNGVSSTPRNERDSNSQL